MADAAEIQKILNEIDAVKVGEVCGSLFPFCFCALDSFNV
jgi:hypothetical protein